MAHELTPAEIVQYILDDQKNGSVKLNPVGAKLCLATAGAIQADPKNREHYIQAMFVAGGGATKDSQLQATADAITSATVQKDQAAMIQAGAEATEQKTGLPLDNKQLADVLALKLQAEASDVALVLEG